MPDLIREAAEKIDAHYDEMLVDGMPDWQVLWVEQQREAAHQELTKTVLQVAMQFPR